MLCFQPWVEVELSGVEEVEDEFDLDVYCVLCNFNWGEAGRES